MLTKPAASQIQFVDSDGSNCSVQDKLSNLSSNTSESTTVLNHTVGANLSLIVTNNTINNITLTSSTCHITIQSNLSDQHNVCYVYLMLKQGSGANQVTWGDNIKWSYSRLPRLSYEPNYIDMITLMTLDGGVSWIGNPTIGWLPA